MSKRAVVAIVWTWIAILTVTHFGARSPYSYGWAMFDHPSARISGAVVNPDAIPTATVTRFFYDTTAPDWTSAENIRLPLHAFSVAMLMAFTRSFLLSNVLANVFFAWLLALACVNLAERFGIDRRATLIALLTCFSLPQFVEYLAQPLQYIVGPAVSFLVILSIVALDEVNPLTAAMAAALLLLNYDPYVYVAALVAWLLATRRITDVRRFALFAITTGVPVVLWGAAVRVLSEWTATSRLRNWFVLPVLSGWTDFLMSPLERVLLPFVATHVGLHVALHQLIAMIYWPLLAALVWKFRTRIAPRFLLVALLPLFFLLEQMAAAAWDWELNPRRAIPAVLAFGVAYVLVVHQARRRRAFIALLALSAFLAMADTLLDEPALTFLHTGQAVRHDVHDVMRVEPMEISSMPAHMDDQHILWRDTPSAHTPDFTKFAISQLFALALLAGVLGLAARAQLLPRWSPHAAASIWVLSLVRFL
jgi:hypothetical protein